MEDLLCPSVHFCHSHGQCCIRSVACFKQTCAYHRGLFICQMRETTLQQGVTWWKQGSSPKRCACSDIEARVWKGNLKDYCKDKDKASDVFPVSHNPAIIIFLYANAEEVGNYSQACFTLLVLPDLRLKRNSARLHRKYRAKPHSSQALSKGLCWPWGQGLGRALQERCWLRKLFEPWAVSLQTRRRMRSCTSTVCIQTGRWSCSLRERELTRSRICQTLFSSDVLRLVTWGILFFRTVSWGSSSSSFSSLHIHKDWCGCTTES